MNDTPSNFEELRERYEQLQREHSRLRAEFDRRDESIRKYFEDCGMGFTPEDLAEAIPGEPFMAELIQNLLAGKAES